MKEKKLLYGILIVFVFLLSIGLTYAYFSVTANVEGEPTDMEVSVGTLNVLFVDGPQISLPEAEPGDSISKVFSVKNYGSFESYYKINWSEFNNGIIKDELAVSFTCTSYSTYLGAGNAGNVESGKCDNMTEEAAYDRDLKTNIKIPVGYTHVYNLTIKLLDINVEQNYNQGKQFNGVLQIEGDLPSWVESCEGNNSLRCRIINNNIQEGQTEVPRDDTSSTYVTTSTGIDFAAVAGITNGQGLYRDTKYGDGNNYYFRGDSFCAYTDYLGEVWNTGEKCTAVGGTWSTNYDFKCSLDYNESACETAGFTYYRLNNNVSFAGYMWKIIRIDEEGNVRLLYNGTSTTARGASAQIGTASYSSQIGDNAFTGYMQPTPLTYKVGSGTYSGWASSNRTDFAMGTEYTMNPETGLFTLGGTVTTGGYTASNIGKYTCCSTASSGCAYVARIEEVDVISGTNRLKTSTIFSGNFTTTKEQAESNEINSPLKTLVDNWYRDNIANKTEVITLKIANTSGYCNDRRVNTLDGGISNTETTYSTRYRVNNTHIPTYKCSHESNDLFTRSGTTKGNNKLTYPVGLITADELAYAGSLYGNNNFRVYAHSGYWYWTLSPSLVLPAATFSVHFSSHGIFSYNFIHYDGGGRPIVSLASTATVNADTSIGGDGSLEHPYIIE